MADIPLAPEYIPLVQTGRKTSTVRAGRRHFQLGEHRVVCGARSIPVTVTAVEHKRLAELSEPDARVDGFESLSELVAALRRFYPRLTSGDLVTVVHFHVKDGDG